MKTTMLDSGLQQLIKQRPSVDIVVNAVFPHNILSVVHDSSLGAGIKKLALLSFFIDSTSR